MRVYYTQQNKLRERERDATRARYNISVLLKIQNFIIEIYDLSLVYNL